MNYDKSSYVLCIFIIIQGVTDVSKHAVWLALLSILAGICSASAQVLPSVVPRIAPDRLPREAMSPAARAQRSAALRAAWAAAHPGAKQDSTLPSISAGQLLSSALNANLAPATPQLTLTYSTGASGLYFIDYFFTSPAATGTSPQTYGGSYFPNIPTTGGTLTLQDLYNSLSRYAAPGVWTFAQIDIYDNAGNFMSYYGSTLSSIFSTTTFTVTNTKSPDIKPPVLVAGKILTPSVSLGSANPYFEAKLTLSDNMSGVRDIQITLIAPNGSGGSNYLFAFTGLSAPITKGTAIASIVLSSRYNSPGTYTIASYAICDEATNCVYDDSAADIQKLFATTSFTVTE